MLHCTLHYSWPVKGKGSVILCPAPLRSTPLHSAPLRSTPLHSTPIRSTPLHCNHSLPGTPPLLLLPRPCPARPLTPTPFPPLLTLPFLALPSGISPSITTTAKKTAYLAARWPACIGLELAALQYIARPYSASGELKSVSPPFPPPSLSPPAAGISISNPSFAAVVSPWSSSRT